MSMSVGRPTPSKKFRQRNSASPGQAILKESVHCLQYSSGLSVNHTLLDLRHGLLVGLSTLLQQPSRPIDRILHPLLRRLEARERGPERMWQPRVIVDFRPRPCVAE